MKKYIVYIYNVLQSLTAFLRFSYKLKTLFKELLKTPLQIYIDKPRFISTLTLNFHRLPLADMTMLHKLDAELGHVRWLNFDQQLFGETLAILGSAVTLIQQYPDDLYTGRLG